MATHNETGRWGEALAAKYLRQKAYFIVRQDWKCGHWDLDIVAVAPDRRTLVVVEVKTRHDEAFRAAREAVDKEKIRNIGWATQAFIREFKVNAPVRFDIITVVGDSIQTAVISHTEDAFKPYL